MDKRNKRFMGPVAGVTAALGIMMGSGYVALSTDAFIDVGEVTQLAGADTSIYNQQDMRRESQQYLFGIFQNVEEEKIEEDNTSTDGASDSTMDNTYSGDSVYDSSAISGTGTGGTQVATVGTAIPVYNDTTATGGTFIDVRQAYASKGVTDYTDWAAYMLKCTSAKWSTNRNMNQVSGIHKNDAGNVVDGEDRILIAVGPGVMNPGRDSMAKPSASEMRYGTKIDVVLDSNGTKYYLHCTVGECKAHTYPSWIIQTGYTVQNSAVGYVVPGKSDNTWTACDYDNAKAQAYSNAVVEFCLIADNSTTNCSNYSIVGFIVY